MPIDVPDWTGQQLVQLLGRSGALLGDPTTPVLAADSAIATISTGGGISRPGVAVLASFKAAGGTPIARVGSLGSVVIGTANAVSPTYGQPTTAGNFLLAWVSADGGTPTTVQAGWVQVITAGTQTNPRASLWVKLNCGAAEAAPIFTTAGFNDPMMAQLAEFSGVALAAATDQSGSATAISSTLNPVTAAGDVASTDLEVMVARWHVDGGASSTVTESFANASTSVHAGDAGGGPVVFQASHSYAIGTAGTPSLPLWTDPSDRAARLLGHVTVDSTSGTVDVSDRAARLLGHVTVDSTAGTVDVSDRAARALGVIASITAPVDVSDRAARLLGAVSVPGSTATPWPSLSRGVGNNQFQITNPNYCKGIQIYIQTLAGVGGTVTVTLNAADNLYTFVSRVKLTSPAIGPNSAAQMTLYPGIAAVANQSANDLADFNMQLSYSVAGAPITFQIQYALLP